jgi:DNA-binding NarL/FixJ family response regulator
VWLGPDRKKNFYPMINRAPSKRREQVLERLLLGWKDREIAQDLGISFHRTRNLVAAVLRRQRAHSRKELIARQRRKGKKTTKPVSTAIRTRVVALARER